MNVHPMLSLRCFRVFMFCFDRVSEGPLGLQATSTFQWWGLLPNNALLALIGVAVNHRVDWRGREGMRLLW